MFRSPRSARPLLRAAGTLVLVAAAGAAAVGLSAALHARTGPAAPTAAEAAIPVETAALRLDDAYPVESRHLGRIEAARAVALAFDLGGRVEAVLVEEGDRVAPGQALARLDVDRLEARLAELDAEAAALERSCEHAQLADGQRVLELGCGWGSLTLWMAERYPGSHITAVSNSASQREFIESRARERGLTNIRIVTADMNDFDAGERFDRVVSIEMFEHMRNYDELLRRVSTWLAPDGRLFVHVFAHRSAPYAFETTGAANWMGRHFFTGGIMPSLDLFDRFDDHLRVAKRWTWDGTHYEKTAEAWLENLDRRRRDAVAILERSANPASGERQFHRWRLFFMACAELFGYDAGREWLVGHYLFEPVAAPGAREARAPVAESAS